MRSHISPRCFSVVKLLLIVGFLALTSLCARAQNLVADGDFTQGTHTFQPSLNGLDGWTISQSGTLAGMVQQVSGTPWLTYYKGGSGLDGQFSQTIATTAGLQYIWSATINILAAANSHLSLSIGALQLFNDQGIATAGLVTLTGTFSAPSDNALLAIVGHSSTAINGDVRITSISVTPAAVPEPGALCLLGIGSLAGGFLHTHRRRAASTS